MARLLLAASLLLPLLASARLHRCEDKCEYRLCSGHSLIEIGHHTSGRALTGPICVRSQDMQINYLQMGDVAKTGEAHVLGQYILPISLWHPRGLEHRFRPDFFKLFEIPGGRRHKRHTIGHVKLEANQIDFLNGTCFGVPIQKYQLVDKKGTAVRSEKSRYVLDCVVFQTFVKGEEKVVGPTPVAVPDYK